MSEDMLDAMPKYLEAAKEAGVTPVSWHISDPLARSISISLARPAVLFGLPVYVHDEWSWGWMMKAKRNSYDWDHDARFWNPADNHLKATGGAE